MSWKRSARRVATPVAAALLLAGCGSGSGSSVSTATHPSSGSTASSPSGSSNPPAPFVPHTAQVSVAPWHLPTASGRQGLVPVGGGAVVLAGGLVAGDQSSAQAMRIQLSTGHITTLPSLAVPVHDVAAGLVGGAPAVVGGGNATEQDVVQVLRGGSWRVAGHLPSTRSDLSVVQRGAQALVIGGYDGATVPTTILALNADGSSRPAGQLSQGVRYAATAVSGHTAYVFGGEVLDQELSAVQAVDLRTGRTRVVARLPVPLGHAMAAVVGTRILLMGGRVTPDRQTNAMWWFDPATHRFSPAGHLPVGLSDAAVTASGHRVWLLGGEDPAVTDRVLVLHVR